jgi:hypothetical protein
MDIKCYYERRYNLRREILKESGILWVR